MTVKVELTREVAARLSAQAQARGLSLDGYLEWLIQEHSQALDVAAPSAEEWQREVDSWVDSFPDTPLIPDEALRRENLYPDRW